MVLPSLTAPELGLVPAMPDDTAGFSPAVNAISHIYQRMFDATQKIMAQMERVEDKLINDMARSTEGKSVELLLAELARERGLQEHFTDLIRELRMLGGEFRQGIATKFKIEDMRQARLAQAKAAANGGGQRTVAGWVPKSELVAQTNNIVTDQVIINNDPS